MTTDITPARLRELADTAETRSDLAWDSLSDSFKPLDDERLKQILSVIAERDRHEHAAYAAALRAAALEVEQWRERAETNDEAAKELEATLAARSSLLERANTMILRFQAVDLWDEDEARALAAEIAAALQEQDNG